jgi:hypothetical protein
MPPKELMRGLDMDTNLAWEMIRVSFSVGRELRDLLLRLKEQCSAEEYKGHARAIAGAIDGVNTALIDRALATQPELEDRIGAELAEFGASGDGQSFAKRVEATVKPT